MACCSAACRGVACSHTTTSAAALAAGTTAAGSQAASALAVAFDTVVSALMLAPPAVRRSATVPVAAASPAWVSAWRTSAAATVGETLGGRRCSAGRQQVESSNLTGCLAASTRASVGGSPPNRCRHALQRSSCSQQARPRHGRCSKQLDGGQRADGSRHVVGRAGWSAQAQYAGRAGNSRRRTGCRGWQRYRQWC